MPEGKITPAAQEVIEGAMPRSGETLADACQRVAIDALYETRNDGGTMHDAGIAAGDAARACVAQWFRVTDFRDLIDESNADDIANLVQEGSK